MISKIHKVDSCCYTIDLTKIESISNIRCNGEEYYYYIYFVSKREIYCGGNRDIIAVEHSYLINKWTDIFNVEI